MGRAIANTNNYPTGYYYVGHTKSIFASETENLFKYVVDTLNVNHNYAEQQLPSVDYKVNPTNSQY
jgi:hypothetical protein